MHLNLQKGGIVMAKKELKKYDESIRRFIDYNGDGLDEFYRPALEGRGTEFYIKFYTHLIDFRLKAKTKLADYYVSTKGIMELFNVKEHHGLDGKITYTGFGNKYCKKTIQRSLQKLIRLRLVSYVIAPKKSDRKNPDEFEPHRKIVVDMEIAKELFNIYEPEVDQFITSYAQKIAIDEVDHDDTLLTEEAKDEQLQKLYKWFYKQLKKIAQKRPFNYTEKAPEKYQAYKEAGIAKNKYSNTDEMISYYKYHTAKKYTKRNLFKKYIPTHLRDKQKEADDKISKGTSPYGMLTEEHIKRIRELPVPEAMIYVRKLIGYSIPSVELQKKASRVFIKVDIKEHKVLEYDLKKAERYMDISTQIVNYEESDQDASFREKYSTGGFDPL